MARVGRELKYSPLTWRWALLQTQTLGGSQHLAQREPGPTGPAHTKRCDTSNTYVFTIA